jgi:hypothetical protein
VDVAALRTQVRQYLRTSLDCEPASAAQADPAQADPAQIPALNEYLLVRQRTVTSLVSRLAAAIRAVSPRTRVVLLDVSPASGLGAEQSLGHGRWNGLDLPALAVAADSIAFTAYADSSAAVADLASAYRSQAGAAELEGVLRPGWPDSRSPADLREKIAALAAHEVEDLSFYHYGLMRLQSLDWIRQATSHRH